MDEMRIAENNSIEDEEDKTNEQGFAGIDVVKDETLGYEKKRYNPQRMLQTVNGVGFNSAKVQEGG